MAYQHYLMLQVVSLTSRGSESFKYRLEQDSPSIRAAAIRGATRLANAVSCRGIADNGKIFSRAMYG